MALARMDEREQIDLVLDKDWTNDPRVPAIKEIAENSFYIAALKFWPDVDFDQYGKFFIPVQCERSKAAIEMIRRNREAGVIKYIWPNSVWKDTMLHEIDVNIGNVKRLGYNGSIPMPYIPLSDVPRIKKKSSSIVFGLCNGAFKAKIWEKKYWPYFSELVIKLKKYFRDCIIVGIGGKDELTGCALDYDYTGKLRIMETNSIINQLDYLISTDTGCMHIADALKVKGLALFGPTLISKNGPVYGTMKPVRTDVVCAPCQEEEDFYTCNANTCMDMMTSSMVINRTIQDTNL